MPFATLNEKQRMRLGHGPMDILDFHLQRLRLYRESTVELAAKYPKLLRREMDDLLNNAIRETHCLSWNDANKPNLYIQADDHSGRKMEHTIPVSHWTAMFNAADEALKGGVLFAAWCGPVARMTALADAAINGIGETTINLTPATPFQRYVRAGYDAMTHPGVSVADLPLDAHYARIAEVDYMKPVFAFARAELRFDEVLTWVMAQRPIAAVKKEQKPRKRAVAAIAPSETAISA